MTPALDRFVRDYGLVPAALTGRPAAGRPAVRAPLATLVTSLFLHGGWLHLLGNMLYLWIFGNNVEDRFGRLGFLALLPARRRRSPALAPGRHRPDTRPSRPSGRPGRSPPTLGAYVVLFPRARVTSLVFLGFFYQLHRRPGGHRPRLLVRPPADRRARPRSGRSRPAAASPSSPTSAGSSPGAVVACLARRRSAAAATAPAGDRRVGRGIIRRMDDGLVEMVVESVRVHMLSSRHVVILKETDRDRYLPIWIGPWEASAIAMKLQGLTPERPLTHDLFATTLEELGRRGSTGSSSPSSPTRRSTPGSSSSATAGRSRSTRDRPTRSRWRSGPASGSSPPRRSSSRPALGGDGGIADDERGRREGSTLEATGESIVDPRLDVFRDFVNSLDVDPDRRGPDGAPS